MIALSDAEWAPFWISYKALKKKIKELDPEERVAVGAGGPTATGGGEGSGGEGQGSATNTEPTPKALAQSAGEVRAMMEDGGRYRYRTFSQGVVLTPTKRKRTLAHSPRVCRPTGGLLQDDPRGDRQGHGVLPGHGAADGRAQAAHPVRDMTSGREWIWSGLGGGKGNGGRGASNAESREDS